MSNTPDIVKLQEAPPEAKGSRLAGLGFWRPAIITISLVFLTALVDVLVGKWFTLLAMLVLAFVAAIYILGSLFACIKSNWASDFARTFPAALLFLIVKFGLFVPIRQGIEAARILVTPQFSSCQNQATPVGDIGFFGVCASRDVALMAADGFLAFDIIYDSTDQIGIDYSKRADVWKKTVDPMLNGTHGDHVFVEKIIGHYYRVTCNNCLDG
ncbi:MAG: hypothetical protein PSY14_15235 [bacterium]|nr:hypothetical protein [bacterium]